MLALDPEASGAGPPGTLSFGDSQGAQSLCPEWSPGAVFGTRWLFSVPQKRAHRWRRPAEDLLPNTPKPMAIWWQKPNFLLLHRARSERESAAHWVVEGPL